MKSRLTLGEVLRRALVLSPIAASLVAGAGCGEGGAIPCGHETIIVNANPMLPDGGVDCSACSFDPSDGHFDVLAGCNPVSVNGQLEVACKVNQVCAGGGRRPASLVAFCGGRAANSVGALFAQMARLEAASIRAFRILAGELAAHRAPRELVEGALRSAREEARHAAATGNLARRYGTNPLRPRYARTPGIRPLREVALENEVEGCVRETFGVAVAAWQATHAADPAIARTMAAIARDELRHAELGWAVAEWAASRLEAGARRQLADARAFALLAIPLEDSPMPARDERRLAGLPSEEQHFELTSGFRRAMDAARA